MKLMQEVIEYGIKTKPTDIANNISAIIDCCFSEFFRNKNVVDELLLRLDKIGNNFIKPKDSLDVNDKSNKDDKASSVLNLQSELLKNSEDSIINQMLFKFLESKGLKEEFYSYANNLIINATKIELERKD